MPIARQREGRHRPKTATGVWQTLLSVNRGGQTIVNPAADFVLESGDDAVVVAESLGTLAPLQMGDARTSAPAAAPA